MGSMKSCRLLLKVAGALTLGMLATTAFAQQKFELVTGKAFDQAVPKDFYLEGNAIPTEKRNAAVVKTPSGGRAVFALIDTAGYSADITTKYVGMLITEGDLQVCGKTVTTGSYGFGWKRPAAGVNEPGTFLLYDQAGKSVTECQTPRDADIKMPKPLQVVIAADGTRLYYGRHYLALK
jgi:hypothetical protein